MPWSTIFLRRNRRNRSRKLSESDCPGRVTELSLQGCFLETSASFPEKRQVLLKIHEADESFEAEAVVLYGATKIVVGLEHVIFVDSAGLGTLIEIHRKTKAKGGRLMLTNLGPKLRQALEIARLLPIFETCATESDAVASF